jgi:uncharacterized membrane protein YwzB
MGYLITILGAYTAFRLWGDQTALSIVTIVVTLYQASSLNEIIKGNDRFQIVLNFIVTLVIIALFITSFFI